MVLGLIFREVCGWGFCGFSLLDLLDFSFSLPYFMVVGLGFLGEFIIFVV